VQVTTKAIDGTTVGAIIAGAAGIGAGLGIPIFFSRMDARDKERMEEVREMNRANLKATGETLDTVSLQGFASSCGTLQPYWYLDR